jgi:hypothetical protein
VIAIRFRFWLGGYLFLAMCLISLWQFAYLAVAIRRFYLAALPMGRSAAVGRRGDAHLCRQLTLDGRERSRDSGTGKSEVIPLTHPDAGGAFR